MREDDAIARCRAALEAGSKSFAFAARLLPARCRDDAAVLYAWCRRADDAIDEAPPGQAAAALGRLREEVDALFRGAPLEEVTREAMRQGARRRALPRAYMEALLDGMAMDVAGHAYRTERDLLLYAHRVAGVVGLMMCHVLGLRDDGALVHAAHLGWGMQLTNIARDVAEDWEMGRLYLPAAWLEEAGARELVAPPAGTPFPDEAAAPVARVVARLLERAEGFYASGDRGLDALAPGCALAVGAARRIYHAIGDEVAARGHDVRRGRAWVPAARKSRLAARAALDVAGSLPRRARAALTDPRPAARPPALVLRFEDLLPR